MFKKRTITYNLCNFEIRLLVMRKQRKVKSIRGDFETTTGSKNWNGITDLGM